MKKLLTVFGVLLGCSSVFCHAAEDSKMKMVTYFPVPYVAYSQVQVSEQMDVGLNNSCQMTLGDPNANYSLSATRVNLNKGKLDLMAASPSSSSLSNAKTVIGADNGGAAEVNFSNLSVGSVTNAKSIEAEVFNPSSLKIFGYPFPDDCNADISWQRVKLNAKDEVYLVCGAAEEEEAPCAPTYNGLESYTEACPLGSTGNIRYTWDYTNCKYTKTNLCKLEAEPVVSNYGYILTNQQKSVGGNLCTVACMMTAYNAPVGGLTSIPSSYGADYFSPNCTASNLGHTCNMNLTVSGTQYCATYTCKKL